MMMQGLSLDQAPPYKIPFVFYTFGGIYLFLSALFLLFSFESFSSLYSLKTISLVHLFVFGFFLHVMIGTMFQMVPVLLGVAFKKTQIHPYVILFFLNTALILLLAYLFFSQLHLLFVALCFALFSLFYYGVYALFTLFSVYVKDTTATIFIVAHLFFLLGLVFAFLMVLGYMGYGDFSPFRELHIISMVFGWMVFLISGIAMRVVPMFYVAKEYPLFCKNYFYKLFPTVLLLFFISSYFEFSDLALGLKTVLALWIISFASITIFRIYNRKRARSDTTILLWYSAMGSFIVASFVWLITLFSGFETIFLVGLFFVMGFFSLILGMLFKIIPFLTWIHLSALGIFEAEMADVADKRVMKIIFYLFTCGYFFALASFWFAPLLGVTGVLLLFLSLLLLALLFQAQSYYKKSLN